MTQASEIAATIGTNEADPPRYARIDPWSDQMGKNSQVGALGQVRIYTSPGRQPGPDNRDFCPRHGRRYVIKSGTNRCPVGRKHGTNCR